MLRSVKINGSGHSSRLPSHFKSRVIGRIPAGNRSGGIPISRPGKGEVFSCLVARDPLPHGEEFKLFDLLKSDSADSEDRGKAAIRLSLEGYIDTQFIDLLCQTINDVSIQLVSNDKLEVIDLLKPIIITVSPGQTILGKATKQGLLYLVATLYNTYGHAKNLEGRKRLLRSYDLTHENLVDLIKRPSKPNPNPS